MTWHSHASLAGSEHPNQDRAGMSHGVAWVIDGASRPGGRPGVVETYVTALSDALDQAAGTYHDAPLTQILQSSIAATATTTASATVAMARTTPTGFDWLVLGDAAVHAADIGLVTDDRLAHVGADLRAARTHERATHGPGARYVELTRQLLAVEDAHRNRPGGFWVAADVPEAAGQALTGSSSASSLLLMSDGAAELVEIHDQLHQVGTVCPLLLQARAALGEPIDDITALVLHH